MTKRDISALDPSRCAGAGHQSLAWRAVALCEAIVDARTQDAQFHDAVHEVARRLVAGGTVFTAGNGGSAAQAQHLAAELVGRLSAGRERGPLSARAIVADAVVLTALANDYGYREIFARQVAASCRAGDVLFLISTSGQSENLTAAAEVARELGVFTVALIGAMPSPLDRCDVVLRTNATDPGTIQEVHLLLVHALTEAVEDEHARLTARNNSEENQ